jgi:hypothetical protein
MPDIRSADLVMGHFLNDLYRAGHEPNAEDMEIFRQTFTYATAELHDSLVNMLRLIIGKRPIPRLFPFKEANGPAQ